MNTVPIPKNKKIPLRNIIVNKYKGDSPAIEKHILGALVKVRDQLYSSNPKLPKKDLTSKEKENNAKAQLIINEIMSSSKCPKELQDLNCTVFFLSKGGGYQFWGNVKHYLSVSFGDDTILILLN